MKIIFEDMMRNGVLLNTNHPILFGGNRPNNDYDDKGISDVQSILLWNVIMGDKYSIDNINDLKSSADKYIKYFEIKYGKGYTANESELIRFVTAFSSSSFIGIQNPKLSLKSYESMEKTLEAHSNVNIPKRPWLYKRLRTMLSFLEYDFEVMEKRYGDVCLYAKSSSASMKGFKTYRDMVLETDWDSIVSDAIENKIPLLIYAGTRIDRRGKYRLICSFDARIRVIDYMVNNGSYALCEHDGVFSEFTTEGYNNRNLWPELVKMSNRDDGKVMICIDYEGYDSQIKMDDYTLISYLLNKGRISRDVEFANIFKWYSDWMIQPKPLVTLADNGVNVLLSCYRTLPSGKHGTHSFENIIGIATYLEARDRGLKCYDFWANGDDQNILIHSSDVDDFMTFISNSFKISAPKSLISHKLSVWSKLWFAKDFHPFWEIGTFRSIWEKEGGEVDFVESSKIETNYAKILQVAITLIRLNKPRVMVYEYIKMLCNLCDPVIDYDRIPKTLQVLKQTHKSGIVRDSKPVGLDSEKSYLKSKTFDAKLLEVDNYYDMLKRMWKKREFFTLEPDNVEYLSKGTILRIESGFNYSDDGEKNIPWIFNKFYVPSSLNDEQLFVRSVLQSTKSYDGPHSKTYEFHDMLTLSYAINDRNRNVWSYMSK